MDLAMYDIAVLGAPEEPEVKRLVDALAALQHPPLVIDTFGFPWEHHLSFVNGCWWYDDHDLTSIKAFFLRNLNCNPVANDNKEDLGVQAAAKMHALREKDSLLGSLLRLAESRRSVVLNPIDTLKCHFYMLETFERLRTANVRIPDTLGTNDLEAIGRFAQEHAELIYKPLAGGGEAVVLSASDLSPLSSGKFRIAPVMIQERVFGDDVRAYVLGGEVIASGLLSTEKADFHTSVQEFRPTNLTVEETADAIKAANLMAIRFAGIDLKRTEAGEHVVLGINPAPMFANFEKITGMEISVKIAKYLVDIAARQNR